MARLSQSPEAPKQERLVSGITACDLYENKLNQPERALAVLVQLHKEGLSTLPVRELRGLRVDARRVAATSARRRCRARCRRISHVCPAQDDRCGRRSRAGRA